MERNELGSVVQDIVNSLADCDIEQIRKYAAILGKSQGAGIPIQVIPRPLLIDSVTIRAKGTFEESRHLNGGLGGVIFRVLTVDGSGGISRTAGGEHEVTVSLSPRDIPFDQILDPDLQNEVGNG